MDRTVACQFALAYRSPMVSAGKPHGAIGSLHIADLRVQPAGVSQAVNRTLEALCGARSKTSRSRSRAVPRNPCARRRLGRRRKAGGSVGQSPMRRDMRRWWLVVWPDHRRARCEEDRTRQCRCERGRWRPRRSGFRRVERAPLGRVLQDHVRGERSAASLMVRRRTFTPSSGVQRSLTYSRTAAGG